MNADTTSALLVVSGKVAGDVVSFGIVLASLAQFLPPLAALISILWIGFQFYHSEPMKARRNKRKEQNGNS